MIPDRLPLQYIDIFQPERQADGSWVYEANPHGHAAVHFVNGPVLHFNPPQFGYSVPVTLVGLPPHDFVNDSFGP